MRASQHPVRAEALLRREWHPAGLEPAVFKGQKAVLLGWWVAQAGTRTRSLRFSICIEVIPLSLIYPNRPIRALPLANDVHWSVV